MTSEEIRQAEKKLQEMKNKYMEERPKCENVELYKKAVLKNSIN